MPIDRYFSGHGDEVMADMKDEYGSKKGTSVFYATVNARKKGQGPKRKRPSTRDQARALKGGR